MFACAYSRAAALVRPTTPCFAATYAAPLKPLTPAPEEVFTITPPPCLSSSGISYFILGFCSSTLTNEDRLNRHARQESGRISQEPVTGGEPMLPLVAFPTVVEHYAPYFA